MSTSINNYRRRLSRAEAFDLIERFLSSGMKANDYYHRHGISEWQFYKWKRLYLLEHPELKTVVKPRRSSSSSSLLSPLHIDFPVSSGVISSFPAIEIRYPGGVSLHISEGLQDTSVLERLLHNR